MDLSTVSATFGGALFQVLRRFYRTDNIAFTFVSDEFNGTTMGNDGQPRPLRPRTVFTAEHEMFRDQVRRFVAEVLNELPHSALESLQIERATAQSPQLQATARLVLPVERTVGRRTALSA